MTGTTAANQNSLYDRTTLRAELNNYDPVDATEQQNIKKFTQLLDSKRCFYRDHFDGEPVGHITASALLLNQDGTKILMNHHKSLNKWLSFGGHCDGEEDVLAVAIRETMEESGITTFKPISSDFIDIDIHEIPANPKKNEPAHHHYDIRYIMQMTDDQQPIISDESINLQWMNFDEALSNVPEADGITRLIKKAQNR